MGQDQPGFLARIFGPSEQDRLRDEQDRLLMELESARIKAETRLLEATTSYTSDYVDPEDALRGDNGQLWIRIGGAADSKISSVIETESKLEQVRNDCRALAVINEYAINGHENRISYIVGTGHQYQAVAKPDKKLSEDQLADAQKVLDEFLDETAWHRRQQEIVRRKDRDGECFLRFFRQADGRVLVRFVEPGQVSTPRSQSSNPAVQFGIETEPDDVETVLAYWIDGEQIDPKEIQHRKANVDRNVRRGLPLFYSVRKLLKKIETIQNNMALLAGIQSAIALIRKHAQGTAFKTPIESRVQADADVQVTNTRYGTTDYFQRYPGGKILDVPAAVEYDFPAHKCRPDAFVPACQQLLRAVASRLVMPEFMLTSDASNANYASTMVAEGPAVKMFERLQHEMVEEDKELLNLVLDNAVEGGRLAQEIRDAVEVNVTTPTLTSRDRLKEAQADEVLVRNEAMSPETMAERHGLDYDVERERLNASREDADLYGGDEDFDKEEE